MRTVKRVLLFMAMSLSINKAWPQHTDSRWMLTPQAGVMVSWMTENALDCRHGFGWTGGIETSYALRKDVSLAFGLFYMRDHMSCLNYTTYEHQDKGMQFYIVDKNWVLFEQMSIPLILSLQVAPQFCLKAGLQADLLLSAEKKGRLRGNHYYEQIAKVQEPVERNVHEDIKNKLYDVGFVVPVGVSYELSRFIFDVRYHFRLGHKIKNNDGNHHYLLLSVGYRLPMSWK